MMTREAAVRFAEGWAAAWNAHDLDRILAHYSDDFEMWWLFLSLARYPRAVYDGPWGRPFGLFFTFVVPVLVVASVPAETMVKTLDPRFIAWSLVATVLMLFLSRSFFRRALQSYRSASS
jgi:ABC-2 type transport system permease protein